MGPVQLIRRENCGLCVLAQDILAQIPELQVIERYLEDDPELVDQYGWRIPVVRIADLNRELDWPFDLIKLQAFLYTP
ncbi:NrdH-redoxin [Ahniella affigens]|uniref:NrdH-redoxin n=1 Tax=Ahniella affigens TaxID=2021234 RepID=A0A2P1PRK7_9GAMM|nr:glutaredoxin family protein [Ahniella affigens]AVP97471.1 NrdH-redoxin [Ahniella affigens]